MITDMYGETVGKGDTIASNAGNIDEMGIRRPSNRWTGVVESIDEQGIHVEHESGVIAPWLFTQVYEVVGQ